MLAPVGGHEASVLSRARREQDQWARKYLLLWDFAADHVRLPAQSATMLMTDAGVEGEVFKVGQWVDSQRGCHRRDKLDPLRVWLLEQVPGWSWGQRRGTQKTVQVSWAEMHRLLLVETTRLGRMPTATTVVDTPAGPVRLGAWCHRRKVDFRVGRLSPDWFWYLDQTPYWEWAQPRLRWNETYQLLVDWVLVHGCLPHADVEVEVWAMGRPTTVALGNWVRLQRFARGRGRLDADQIALLESIPGWTWPDTFEAFRDLTLAEMRAEMEREGHITVPPEPPE